MDRFAQHAVLPLIVFAAFVYVAYGLRIDDLTIRGEESRRATVAMEMAATGDWAVPRQQGDPFFLSSRPPLQAWLIAAAAKWRGGFDPIAVRLPSILAVFLTAVLLFAYASTFLSRTGAFAAGAAYLSFGHVLELGRLGETDGLFALFVGASMVAWHAGYTRRWPPIRTWCVAYVAVGLATLTKGPQAPTYFGLAVGLFLLLERDLRFLWSWAHAAGLAVFVAIVGAWFVPFWLSVGTDGVRHVFTGDVGAYLIERDFGMVARHVLGFPFEVLGALLPWSLLLPALCWRSVRAGSASQVRFFVGAILIAFPTVWFVPGARTRFFMSLYPCFAILAAIVVDRAAVDARASRAWRAFVAFLIVLMVGVAVVLPCIKGAAASRFVGANPWWVIAAVSAGGAALALAMWRAREASVQLSCVAVFVAMLIVVPATNHLMRKSNRADLEMARIASEVLPPDSELVSFGPIHHLFAYHHGRPIEIVEPGDAAMLDADYACGMEPLPEPYVEIARVFCGRNWRGHRDDTNTVRIGRRTGGSPR